MWILILSSVLIVGLAIWELWICEGAHLGRGFVVWLYDLAAFRYEKIKQFDPVWERRFLGEPLAAVSSEMKNARILDIGAGTGRIARTLSPLQTFQGMLTSLEPSRRMLALGRRLTPPGSTIWVQAWSVPLPFAEGSFDIVVSLEMLEFTPKPLVTLTEMVRVLCPGGWLLVTNRVGREAPLILGRTFRRDDFPQLLKNLGLQDITVYPWQVTYDLAWARKTHDHV
jgi:ubiquinone/menaquinone biosynthesis C-methylase UbiE